MMILFFILMMATAARMMRFAVRMSWGFMKVFFTILFLPSIIFFGLLGGLLKLALPALLIYAVISMLAPSRERDL
jgi:hypothetical protein